MAKLTVAFRTFAKPPETRFLRMRLELDFVLEKKTGKAEPDETEIFYRKCEFNDTRAVHFLIFNTLTNKCAQ
jgi:hypothetical protein